MQTDSHILDDVARVATGAMGAASGLKGELDALVKRRLEGSWRRWTWSRATSSTP